jgi:hypothetical protein
MGQIKQPAAPPVRESHGTGPKDRPVAREMIKEKVAAVDTDKPKVRYSYDGFWTTQHPDTTAFSIEWFKIHFSMIPYCWVMLKMALSVSKASVLIVAMGTVCRAIIDAAQLYAYTRFVNEVRAGGV